MNIGHVVETIKLLESSFESDSADRKYHSSIKTELVRIEQFEKTYNELLKMVHDNKFYKFVLKRARNNVFHYNRGQEYKKSIFDFEETIETINYLIKDNFTSGMVLSDVRGENSFYFAEEIQLNSLIKSGEDLKLSERELISKISVITSKIMDVLSIIIDDFILNKIDLTKIYDCEY